MKPDKIYLSLIFLLIVTSVTWISSCTHDTDITGYPDVCFQRDVLPVFLNSCAMNGCHSGGSESSLTTYNQIVRNVVPGNAQKSKIYQVISSSWGIQRMPPDQPLSIDNRTLIRLWIEQGAAETTCESPTPVGPPAFEAERACFTRDILPVLASRCGTTGCHDAVSHKEGLVLTSYAGARSIVSARNPAGSSLYRVLTGGKKMPPSNKPQLTIAEIDSIGKWIGYGALNETCAEPCDTINPVTFAATIWPAIQTACTGCHSGTAPSGNILLASYSNVATVASSGLLIKSLKGDGVTKMPQSGSLSACRIRQYKIWVNNGFLNN